MVHACRCRDCQRIMGSALVINLWIERKHVEPTGAEQISSPVCSCVVPGVHIFTRTRLPWVRLPEGARAVPDRYKLEEVWPPEMVQRLRANA